jgi:hypothetical protein
MTETRYWKRVGVRLTKELAYEMESKMNAKGSYLDEDLEEFTAIDSESSDYKTELKRLFESPDEYVETGDPVNGSAAVIDISYHYYRENRKTRLMAIRAELKENLESEKDNDIADMMAEGDSLTLESATESWEKELPNRIRFDAQELWAEEYDAFVTNLQEQYGTAQ